MSFHDKDTDGLFILNLNSRSTSTVLSKISFDDFIFLKSLKTDTIFLLLISLLFFQIPLLLSNEQLLNKNKVIIGYNNLINYF